jgi:hypothetical protein
MRTWSAWHLPVALVSVTDGQRSCTQRSRRASLTQARYSRRLGGEFVAVHWRGESGDHVLHGDEVHAVLKETLQHRVQCLLTPKGSLMSRPIQGATGGLGGPHRVRC